MEMRQLSISHYSDSILSNRSIYILKIYHLWVSERHFDLVTFLLESPMFQFRVFFVMQINFNLFWPAFIKGKTLIHDLALAILTRY